MQDKKILARSVEINLTAHCNLSCYGCDHASPVHPEEYLSVDDLATDLKALSEAYHVFEFLLTGGEPLLHPELLRVIDTIRASGIAEKIGVVTNGVLLHTAPPELWGKIDKMWVSVYPGVKRKLSNDEVKAQAERHGVLLRFKITNEFTTKLLHSENHDPALVQSIYDTCTLRTSCHTLHKGRYYKCSPSPFVADWLQRVHIESPDLLRDSVAVRDNPNLRYELAAYLRDEAPLTACRFCLGCVGKTVPSWQMNKAAAQRWMAEKDPDIGELINWESLGEAQANLKGIDLTGMLPTMAGQKARWFATQWLLRLLDINLMDSQPTMIGQRLRRLAGAWLIPMKGLLRRLSGVPANPQ